ncbi:hypothetical protein PF003_g1819 [Phytophthora fragariae]|nr:hypothetical protein PF003_g1819 [Phytophthora fragariae]
MAQAVVVVVGTMVALRVGGSASQGEGPQHDHHDGNAEEGNMQDDDGSDGEAPTQVADSTTQAADCEDCSRGLSVRLSGNVRRQGRPPLGRAAQKEKAKKALKEYNNGTNLRTLLREKDVCEVVATLHDVKPVVREAGSFLATLQVKSQGQGKPIEWRVDAEFVPDTVRFRLLESVVDSALEQLRGGLAKNEQIELDSDGEAAAGGDRYVAAITKFGQFTRDQVEAMKWL